MVGISQEFKASRSAKLDSYRPIQSRKPAHASAEPLSHVYGAFKPQTLFIWVRVRVTHVTPYFFRVSKINEHLL